MFDVLNIRRFERVLHLTVIADLGVPTPTVTTVALRMR